jgi:large subunit ribosomal protein L2
MAVIRSKPVTPGQRHYIKLDLRHLSKIEPEKRLVKKLTSHSGRNSSGKVTVRHQGAGVKQMYRIIDFKRDKRDMKAKVVSLEYDPNRTVNIAKLQYEDGERRYILAPEGLKTGQTIIASVKAKVIAGNTMPLQKIPVGTPIHNLELMPGKGGQMVRSAGAQAFISAKDDQFANVLLPSGELRRFYLNSWATIGQLSNPDWKNVSFGKAGRKRHMGIRPSVRGVAMHPDAHPHGGGEGRSGIGMPSPKTPWGKPTLGKKTRHKSKQTGRFIIKDRRIK